MRTHVCIATNGIAFTNTKWRNESEPTTGQIIKAAAENKKINGRLKPFPQRQWRAARSAMEARSVVLKTE